MSSIDLIPEEGQDDVCWAMDELNRRQRTQADILFELNDRLAAKGIAPISKSAFNRRAVRSYAASQRIAEQRALFAGIADQFTPESIDEGNIVLGEFIKTLITEIISAGAGRISPKGAMELASGYKAAIEGQKKSSEHRAKLVAEFQSKAAVAVDAVAKSRGLKPEMVDELKAQILGIKK
nr:phage protein Gp27 family protein [Methylocystis sp. WRRC1]